MTKQVLTQAQLDSVAGYPSREAAAKLGVGKSTINDARRLARENGGYLPRSKGDTAGRKSSVETNSFGALIIETQDTVAQDRSAIDKAMLAKGFDPELYTFGYRFSEWETTRDGETITLYAARATATRTTANNAVPLDHDELVAVIDNHVPDTSGWDPEATETFVFNFADPQFGKVDLNGGTDETVARFLRSLDRACAYLDANPVAQIIWADLGDGIENFCNTTSQRQTNDLNLVEQVRILRRIQLEGILRFLNYAPVVHVSVPSNHSQNRVTFQGPASTAHDDWGLEVQQQLIDIFKTMRPELFQDNTLQFISPQEHLESVAFTTASGTRLGFVHGHRSNAQTGLERWWQGQALGRQPTADCDILLVGHFHNLNVNSVGDQRYIITTPSLDNGSSWFTVARGHVATAGVLGMVVRGREFPAMDIY